MQKLIPFLFAVVCICSVLIIKACSVEQESITDNQHYIPNLGIDTLKLNASYSECGEWGGHREVIKIYMSDKAKGTERDIMKWSGPFAAEFWLDTIGCSYRSDRRYFLVKQTELTRQQEAVIMKYINDMIYFSLKQSYPSPSGNVYSVSSSDPHILSIRYFARGNEDNRFEPLRKQLFESVK